MSCTELYRIVGRIFWLICLGLAMMSFAACDHPQSGFSAMPTDGLWRIYDGTHCIAEIDSKLAAIKTIRLWKGKSNILDVPGKQLLLVGELSDNDLRYSIKNVSVFPPVEGKESVSLTLRIDAHDKLAATDRVFVAVLTARKGESPETYTLVVEVFSDVIFADGRTLLYIMDLWFNNYDKYDYAVLVDNDNNVLEWLHLATVPDPQHHQRRNISGGESIVFLGEPGFSNFGIRHILPEQAKYSIC